MAKVKYGPVVADARNSIDGVVYSRNQYGAYTRIKVSPTQPRTEYQLQVRGNMSEISKAWAYTLTDEERAAWETWARNNPVTDVFGNSQVLSGIAAFNRVNGVLLAIGKSIITTPPAEFKATPLATCSISMTSTDQKVSITFTPSPLGTKERLYMWGTGKLNGGRSFFKPFLRLFGTSAAGQASPYEAGTKYTSRFGSFAAGEKHAFLISVVNEDTGAVSIGFPVIVETE
jgi:hypothetical protein